MGQVLVFKRVKEVTQQLDFFDYMYIAAVFSVYVLAIWSLLLWIIK